MAVRLTTAAGPNAILSRFGGMNSTPCCSKIPMKRRRQPTAQRIIESLRQPIMVSDFEIYSGVSIGIAMHPAHGSDISTLLQNADSAMYHAKEQGKNTYSF